LWGCVNAESDKTIVGLCVSMPKDSIRTRVVTVDTAKHYSHRNTACLKDLPFLLIRQHKQLNDTQLRIATVTHFSSSAGTLLQTELFSNAVV